MSIIPENGLKRKLAAGGSAVGTMLVELRQPSVMQVLANAGLDFVIIDTEHGPLGIETIADLSRAARAAGVTPIVRVPDLQYAYVAPALDAGAQGIMLPRVTEPGQVREVLQMMKYPPLGRRGSVLARGHTAFKGGSLADALAEGNAESMLIVQIETKPALDRADEILGIPGVDVGFVGPTDLSVALGVPGQVGHASIVSAIETVTGICEGHGVYPAVQMNDLPSAVAWAGRRIRLLSYSSEISILGGAAADITTAIRSAFAPVRA